MRSTSTEKDFAAAYDEHVWDVYGFLAYRTASRADAEDLTQQTFERALRAWNRFDPDRASAGTWLIAIARNLLIDHYRGDKSRNQVPLEAEDAGLEGWQAPPPEPGSQLSPDLAEAIAALSDREREIIALRYGGDLTGREVAGLTGLTLANVQQINSRALRKLRDALGAPVP
jgi:RNA polymerase sigma-70 factor (ECF subfamily)